MYGTSKPSKHQQYGNGQQSDSIPIAHPVEIKSSLPTIEIDGCTSCWFLCSTISVILLHLLTLVWPIYFDVSSSFFAITMLIGCIGIAKDSAYLILPLASFSVILPIMSCSLMIFTYIDYTQKCTYDKNLADRTLQASYGFDCEAAIFGFIFWFPTMIVSVIVIIIWTFQVLNIYRLIARWESESLTNHLLRNNNNLRKRGKMWRIGSQIFSFGIIASVFITGLYISFHNRSHAVNGICPNNSNSGNYFFDNPRTNDLGCCTWIKSEGTCCQQEACRERPKFTSVTGVIDNVECSDLVGLLSCSFCRRDSGKYVVSGFEEYRVCSSFCNQVWKSCEGYNTDPNATTWCQDTFNGLIIVNDNTSDANVCFNAVSSLLANKWKTTLLIGMITLLSINN